MRFAALRPRGDAPRGLDLVPGGPVVPVVLTDDVRLPGETHRLDADWDGEVAVLAGLGGADGRVVLLPRAVHHSDHRPMIGLLAVVDSLRSDGLGQVRGARLFGLRRV